MDLTSCVLSSDIVEQGHEHCVLLLFHVVHLEGLLVANPFLVGHIASLLELKVTIYQCNLD